MKECNNCGLCLEVCPANREKINQNDIAKLYFEKEKDIHYHPAIGFYLSSYIGYSLTDFHREHGASGGMITWLLERLLSSGSVDRIIVAKNSDSNNVLFKMKIVSSIKEIRDASNSKYYPLELSNCLEKIINSKEEHKYAIVGLPCFLYGIRKAMFQNPRLKKEIKFLIGLVCGHCPNASYTEYLSKLAEIKLKDIKTVNYRVKKGAKTSINYGFQIKKKDGTYSKILWNNIIGKLWNKYYFCHNVCNYCDDIFAEVADIVFMDAWLPEAIPVVQGTSIIVVRNSILDDILVEGNQKGSCSLKPCPIEKVVKSQKSTIEKRQKLIPLYISTLSRCKKWFPRVRGEITDSMSKKKVSVIKKQVRSSYFSKTLWKYLFKYLPSFFAPFLHTIISILLFDKSEWQKIFLKLRQYIKIIIPPQLLYLRKKLILKMSKKKDI